MKKRKGKGKISAKKSIPRYKNIWLDDGGKTLSRLFVKQPDKPPSSLTEAGRAKQQAFPHANDILTDSSPPDKKAKKKASVTCITSAHSKKVETPPIKQVAKEKTKPPKLVKPMSLKKRKRLKAVSKRLLREECATYARWAAGAIKSRDQTEFSYFSKLEHRFWMKSMKRQAEADIKAMFVGPPAPQPIKLCLPKPTEMRHVETGYVYSLAPKKDKVTQCNNNDKKEVTQCNIPSSVMTKVQFEVEARNNPSFSPSVADVKWYINNVVPYDWPDTIKEHTYYLDGGYKPDKAKILGKSKMSLQEQHDALERDYGKLQAKYYRETERLEDEIHTLETELNFAHWEIAVSRDGETAVHEVDRVKLSRQSNTSLEVASEKSSPPAVESLALQYHIFVSQYKDDKLKSFLRSSGHGFEREKELRAYFDKECVTRCNINSERNVYRKWATRDGNMPNREHRQHKVKAWLAARIAKQQRLMYEKPPLNVERKTYEHWGHRKPTCSRRLLKHEVRSWWQNAITAEEVEQRIIDIENKRLMDTTSYKVLKGIKDVATFELNPFERKRKEEKAERKAKLIAKSKRHKRIEAKREECKAKARASRIKRMAEEQSEADIVRQKIRQAMTIAY